MLNEEIFDEYVQKFAAKLGAKSGFIAELYSSDDWSFIIKICAFVEALITDGLSKGIENEREREWIAKHNLDGMTGKISIAKIRSLIGDDSFRYCKVIIELRNRCAHGIKHCGSDLKEMIESLRGTSVKDCLNQVGESLPIDWKGMKPVDCPGIPKTLLRVIFSLILIDYAQRTESHKMILDEMKADSQRFMSLLNNINEI